MNYRYRSYAEQTRLLAQHRAIFRPHEETPWDADEETPGKVPDDHCDNCNRLAGFQGILCAACGAEMEAK